MLSFVMDLKKVARLLRFCQSVDYVAAIVAHENKIVKLDIEREERRKIMIEDLDKLDAHPNWKSHKFANGFCRTTDSKKWLYFEQFNCKQELNFWKLILTI